MKDDNIGNRFKWGQFFTKKSVVRKVLPIILHYKKYDKDIRILEPSSGTKNFITVLKRRGFNDIEDCEIDPELTGNPSDFFNHPISEKFDLIIGNPPFTKYNVKESYYHKEAYAKSVCKPEEYLTKTMARKDKLKVENVFILKSLKHLKDSNSTIGFVLPISFFIKNRNKEVKDEIKKNFSTIIIYQNTDVWFDYHLPCCFAIFTNSDDYRGKIILIFDRGTKRSKDTLDMSSLYEEIIPQVHFNKKEGIVKNHVGKPLSEFLSNEKVRYDTSYDINTVSGKNIMQRNRILADDVENYKLAIVRVGNVSVGRCGLINIKKDILNDMFYVFGFKEEFNKNRKLKEEICKAINENQDYFKNITIRIGSKSIKKSDIFDFKVKLRKHGNQVTLMSFGSV